MTVPNRLYYYNKTNISPKAEAKQKILDMCNGQPLDCEFLKCTVRVEDKDYIIVSILPPIKPTCYIHVDLEYRKSSNDKNTYYISIEHVREEDVIELAAHVKWIYID